VFIHLDREVDSCQRISCPHALRALVPSCCRCSCRAHVSQEGSSKAGAGSSNFMQSFSLPGEAQKAAKILKSFLGELIRRG
jgi:hypothetical protein